MRKKTVKQRRTKTKAISPAEQERRKQKTDAIRRDIRREWAMLESYYRVGKQPRPATPTLERMTAAAGRDFRKRHPKDKHALRVYWRIKGGFVITSRYSISNFDNIRLVPPKQYGRVRQAFGY